MLKLAVRSGDEEQMVRYVDESRVPARACTPVCCVVQAGHARRCRACGSFGLAVLA